MDLNAREQQWAAWLLAGIAGDAESYRRFLNDVTPYLRRVAVRRCATLGAPRSDAEDIVQDVLLAIHLKRGTWDPARPIGPWLAAIVRNKVIDTFRRRGRRVNVPIDDVIETLATPVAEPEPDVKLLGQLLARLKDHQRAIVTSISLDGASVRQTAERLQMTEGAVRVALHRALKSLAALYRQNAGD
ncbi:MAG: sigma-70 region 2 [Tardiphaga sp.]|nr:sigma-70 region 2 [Tardiphaga sp.]